MKETQPHHADHIKIVNQKEAEKQLKHIGTQRIKPGHRCFEICHNTRAVREAQVEKTFYLSGAVQNKVITKQGHFYITALNAENAIRKYKKYFRL